MILYVSFFYFISCRLRQMDLSSEYDIKQIFMSLSMKSRAS